MSAIIFSFLDFANFAKQLICFHLSESSRGTEIYRNGTYNKRPGYIETTGDDRRCLLLPLLIPLFFRLHAHSFLLFSHSFRISRFHVINILLGFLHNVVLFSPFLHACYLALFIIFIATFQGSRSKFIVHIGFFFLPSS